MCSGIIIIDKPAGFTSFDMIAMLRKTMNMRRIGHSGTLDPMATGVLPVFFGTATRACEYAAGHDKEYLVRFRLGMATDTQDITGEIMKTAKVTATKSDVDEALLSFTGRISQIPPMFSAIKKNGKKLYEYARQGIEIERKAREITIFDAKLLSEDETLHEYEAKIVCSSGTYVRTLCADLGEKLGTYAVMTALRRTRSGMFRIENAVSPDEVKQAAGHGELSRYVLPVDTVFGEYPKIRVDSYGARRIKNGAFVPLTSVTDGKVPEKEGIYCRIYSQDGDFLMLGRTGSLYTGGRAVFCEKNFFN